MKSEKETEQYTNLRTRTVWGLCQEVPSRCRIYRQCLPSWSCVPDSEISHGTSLLRLHHTSHISQESAAQTSEHGFTQGCCWRFFITAKWVFLSSDNYSFPPKQPIRSQLSPKTEDRPLLRKSIVFVSEYEELYDLLNLFHCWKFTPSPPSSFFFFFKESQKKPWSLTFLYKNHLIWTGCSAPEHWNFRNCFSIFHQSSAKRSIWSFFLIPAENQPQQTVMEAEAWGAEGSNNIWSEAD